VNPSLPEPLPEATIVLPGQDPILPSQVPASTPVTSINTLTNTLPNALTKSATGSAAKSATAVKPNSGTNSGKVDSGISAVLPLAPQAPISAGTAVSSVPATSLPVPPATAHDWNKPGVSSEAPLFATPRPGGLYLQMGAVDRGIAVVLAEGLRRHGFNSIVAPGPTEKIFRVLIGPFETQDDFRRAKAEVDAIDLGTFARRFQK
jgi:cell division septation protein DedD